VFHPMGQTDMRRYEARQLRYLVDDIIEQEPEANVLVVGDLNDSPVSSPLNTLFARRRKAIRQLFDLRPLDPHGLAWTHHWTSGDSYDRIDYAMVSYHLLPEVRFDRTFLPFDPEWETASDHRPVVVTITPHDRPPGAAETARFERNIRTP